MSVFAGLLIGTGGLVYLRVGGIPGAVLFAFGLLSVVMCGAQLYTGKAGYLPVKDLPRLLIMLAGNAVGCIIAAAITLYVTNDAVQSNLTAILAARSNASWIGLAITSVGTGMIMTLAVYGARQKNSRTVVQRQGCEHELLVLQLERDYPNKRLLFPTRCTN